MNWKIPKIWTGTCWIIGGGVSIAKQFGVPETLIPQKREEFFQFGTYLAPIFNDRVIGVNLGAFVSGKVDVAFWGDSDTYTEFRNWYDNFGGLKVAAAGKFADKRYKSIYHVYKNNKQAITRDPSEVSWLCRNSGAAAISLAYHLGAERIILLGIDLQQTDERVHWHVGYPDKRKTITNLQLKQGYVTPVDKKIPPFKRHAKYYKRVAEEAEELGLEILNANPESAIDCFPKISVKELLNETV